MASRPSDTQSKLNHLLNTDFCPQLNQYVYWLKQPIGWFVIAMIASVLVGAFASPIGWTIALGLGVLIVLGLAFPWLAIRTTQIELLPVIDEVHEREEVEFEVRVRNRLPLPILGLTIRGYLVNLAEADSEETLPEIGLSRVPSLSVAKFRLQGRPEYRGSYPITNPVMGCAFPFGIWTARKEVQAVSPLLVRPLVIPCGGQFDFLGQKMSDVGQGSRASEVGEFLGVREFRAGDSLKSIHWSHTARLDSLVVCERGGPQHQQVVLAIDTNSSRGTPSEAQENLAWRVRVVASIAALLHGQHIPFSLTIDSESMRLPAGQQALRLAWEKLAAIPLAGNGRDVPQPLPLQQSCIQVSAQEEGEVGVSLASHLIRVTMDRPAQDFRNHHAGGTQIIDLDQDIGFQLSHFIAEVGSVPSFS